MQIYQIWLCFEQFKISSFLWATPPYVKESWVSRSQACLTPNAATWRVFFSVANKQWCFFAYIFVNEQKKKTAVISLPIRFYEYQIWSHEYSEGVNTLAEFETDLTCSWKKPQINGILLPKLFWSTVRKKLF